MKAKRAYIKWDIEKCQSFLDKAHFGARILDDVYVNSHTKMNIICEKGHTITPTWDNVQQRHWCSHCAGIAKPIPEYILGFLAEHHPGSIWHDPTEYKNNKTKLHITCEKGHSITPTWHDIQQDYWCPECARNIKLTSEHIISYLHKYHPGYIWNDPTEYKNAFTKLHIICKNKHIFEK